MYAFVLLCCCFCSCVCVCVFVRLCVLLCVAFVFVRLFVCLFELVVGVLLFCFSYGSLCCLYAFHFVLLVAVECFLFVVC